MNWGKAITLSFVLFATFILSIVYKMMHQKVDLVKEDYYKDEVNYQRQIDRMTNAKQYDAAEVMKYSSENNQITIALPESAQSGEILFFRPSDKTLDFKKTFTQEPLFIIPTTTMAKGRWKVKIVWSDGKNEFYKEEELFI